MKRFFLLAVFSAFVFMSCENTKKAVNFYLDAVSEYQNKNFEEAKLLLNSCLKEKKNFYQAEFLLGKIYFFEKDFQNAQKIFIQLSERKKENFDTKIWLLKSYIFNKETSQARILIDELIKNNSEDWRLYYWKAQIAKIENDFETFFSCLNYADQYLSDSSNVYLDLALIWHELGLADKSAFYYSKVNILKDSISN